LRRRKHLGLQWPAPGNGGFRNPATVPQDRDGGINPMNFECLWLLFLAVLPVVWMTSHSCRGRCNSLPVNALRVALLLSALSLPAFATKAAGRTDQVLADSEKPIGRQPEEDCPPGRRRGLAKGESIAPRSLNPHLE
jgi:hypothetical protein